MSVAEGFYTLTVMVHLVTGILALLAFWLPALTRKGSRVHRSAGKVFMLLMLAVIVTGVPLAARQLWLGHWVGGTFLAYLAIIVSTSVASAWYALKLKREPARYYGRVYRAGAWLNIGSGATVLGIGLFNGVPLLMFFSFVGVFGGIDMLKRLRPAQREPNWWLLEHIGGVIGAGIAAHIAFGVFGLRRIWPAYSSLDSWIGMLAWLLPLAIGIPAAIWLTRKYRLQRASENAFA